MNPLQKRALAAGAVAAAAVAAILAGRGNPTIPPTWTADGGTVQCWAVDVVVPCEDDAALGGAACAPGETDRSVPLAVWAPADPEAVQRVLRRESVRGGELPLARRIADARCHQSGKVLRRRAVSDWPCLRADGREGTGCCVAHPGVEIAGHETLALAHKRGCP